MTAELSNIALPFDYSGELLVLAETPEHRAVVRSIIENHHSYVPSAVSVGRRIDWLVVVDGEAVGMVGIGSGVYPPPIDLLHWLGVSKNEYRDIFNEGANNWRFCLAKRIPNLGSRVLREMRQQGPVVWHRKYGNPLRWIVTFVGGGNTGAVYAADNWERIGLTSGLPAHASSSMKWNTAEELSERFVKPTGEDRKTIWATRKVSGGEER